MSDVPSFFIILLVLLAFPYLGGPLLILCTFKFRCPARILFFNEAEIDLPRDVAAFVDPSRDALTALRFQPAAYFCLPDLVNNAKSISVLFSNAVVGEGAIVNCIYAESSGALSLTEKHVEFVTRFRDGVCVQTNNSRQIGAFVQPAEDHTIQFWDLQDVPELYRRHQRICEQLTSSPRRFRLAEEFHNDVEQYLQVAVIKEPIEYQASLGLFRPVSDGFRPTIGGAFRLVWQELWPWKFLRRQSRKRAAARWLAKIG